MRASAFLALWLALIVVSANAGFDNGRRGPGCRHYTSTNCYTALGTKKAKHVRTTTLTITKTESNTYTSTVTPTVTVTPAPTTVTSTDAASTTVTVTNSAATDTLTVSTTPVTTTTSTATNSVTDTSVTTTTATTTATPTSTFTAPASYTPIRQQIANKGYSGVSRRQLRAEKRSPSGHGWSRRRFPQKVLCTKHVKDVYSTTVTSQGQPTTVTGPAPTSTATVTSTNTITSTVAPAHVTTTVTSTAPTSTATKITTTSTTTTTTSTVTVSTVISAPTTTVYPQCDGTDNYVKKISNRFVDYPNFSNFAYIYVDGSIDNAGDCCRACISSNTCGGYLALNNVCNQLQVNGCPANLVISLSDSDSGNTYGNGPCAQFQSTS